MLSKMSYGHIDTLSSIFASSKKDEMNLSLCFWLLLGFDILYDLYILIVSVEDPGNLAVIRGIRSYRTSF